MTGAELKQLRVDLGDAIGRTLSVSDMAKLCGLAGGKSGADMIRRWEVSGPSGPAADGVSRTVAREGRPAGRFSDPRPVDNPPAPWRAA